MDWFRKSSKKNTFDAVRFLLVETSHVYAVLSATEASVGFSLRSDYMLQTFD